jgi:hypothetical protein
MSGWSDPYGSGDEFSFMDGYESGYSGADIQMAGDVVSRVILYDTVYNAGHTYCYYTPFGNVNPAWTHTTILPFIGACDPFIDIPF